MPSMYERICKGYEAFSPLFETLRSICAAACSGESPNLFAEKTDCRQSFYAGAFGSPLRFIDSIRNN